MVDAAGGATAPGPTVRRARATDLPLLYRVELINIRKIEPENLDAWIDTTDRTLERWITNLDRGFVAEINGEAAGIALWAAAGAGGIAEEGADEGTGLLPHAEIIAIHVVGEYRRRGVAHALLEACVRDAGAGGFGTITVRVHRNNPARTIYERFGFSRPGTGLCAGAGAAGADHLCYRMPLVGEAPLAADAPPPTEPTTGTNG